MRELKMEEVDAVNGGTDAGDIAMGIAGAHATGVVGLGVGMVIGGPVGAVAGYGAGVLLAGLITIGYTLAT
jgi:hypothetical protein